jgi:argininosuccinate lyase
VSERDFVIELIFACALIGTHLSRFAEDIIIWKSLEFDYISIGEEFCTGSSLMPQKSNPDIAELVRGKTARLYGNLMQILTLMKALPMAYNRDMQEDKESLFDSIETVLKSLKVFTGMIKTIRFNTDKIALHMSDFILSTDVAEYLVKKGVAFREAHDIVGKIVLFMKENGKRFCDMTLKDFKKFNRAFGEDVVSILSPKASVDSRKLIGGTARKNVLQEIQKWKKKLG